MSRYTVDDYPLDDKTGTSFFRTDFAPLTRAYRRPSIWRRQGALGHAVVLWLCVVVLAVIVPALVFRITWADAMQLLAVIGGAR